MNRKKAGFTLWGGWIYQGLCIVYDRYDWKRSEYEIAGIHGDFYRKEAFCNAGYDY